MTRSRHGREATVLFLAVALVLAFAFLRRFAAPREAPSAPSGPAPSQAGGGTNGP